MVHYSRWDGPLRDEQQFIVKSKCRHLTTRRSIGIIVATMRHNYGFTNHYCVWFRLTLHKQLSLFANPLEMISQNKRANVSIAIASHPSVCDVHFCCLYLWVYDFAPYVRRMTRQKNKINLMRNNNNLFLSSSPSATIWVLLLVVIVIQSVRILIAPAALTYTHTRTTQKNHCNTCVPEMTPWFIVSPVDRATQWKIVPKSRKNRWICLRTKTNRNVSRCVVDSRFFPHRRRWSSGSIIFFQL